MAHAWKLKWDPVPPVALASHHGCNAHKGGTAGWVIGFSLPASDTASVMQMVGKSGGRPPGPTGGNASA